MFTTRTNSTINTVKRMISMPKRRMPTAKAVAGGFSARLVARWPSAVLPPVRQITIVAVPLITEVPAKTALDAPAGIFGARGRIAGLLLGRVGLARQKRLVDEQVAAFEQPRVRRDEIAGDQFDDIAGDQLVDRHREACAVAPHRGLHRHRPAQRLDRILSPDFLDEIKRHADHDDGDDDEETCDVAGRRGQPARDEQDDDQRIAEAGEKLKPERRMLDGCGVVGPERFQARLSFVGIKTASAGREFCARIRSTGSCQTFPHRDRLLRGSS